MVAGLLGALPGAGNTTGTVTSIRAGGRSPLAGALGAIMLLGVVLGAGWLAESIPLAVLAAILATIGWGIIDWRFLARIHLIRREYVLEMLITFSVTVFVDLITAVALGLIAAGVVRSRESERPELDSVKSMPLLDPRFFPETDELVDVDPFSVPVGLVKLTGPFSIASAHDLTRAVAADIEDHDIVILDFSSTTSVDDSAALVIEQLVHAAADRGVVCIVSGLGGEVAAVLHSLMVLHRIPSEHFTDTLAEARDLAASILGKRGGTAGVSSPKE